MPGLSPLLLPFTAKFLFLYLAGQCAMREYLPLLGGDGAVSDTHGVTWPPCFGDLARAFPLERPRPVNKPFGALGPRPMFHVDSAEGQKQHSNTSQRAHPKNLVRVLGRLWLTRGVGGVKSLQR